MKPEELAEAGFFHDPDDDDADLVILNISSKVKVDNPSGGVFPLRVSCLELQAQAPVSLGSACQVRLTNI